MLEVLKDYFIKYIVARVLPWIKPTHDACFLVGLLAGINSCHRIGYDADTVSTTIRWQDSNPARNPARK